MSLHMYWARVYVLSKQVLQGVEKICRAFFWCENVYTTKSSNIAWEKLCYGKTYGGLGFRNVQVWNVASMDKYVWALDVNQENFWVKWINVVYL